MAQYVVGLLSIRILVLEERPDHKLKHLIHRATLGSSRKHWIGSLCLREVIELLQSRSSYGWRYICEQTNQGAIE